MRDWTYLRCVVRLPGNVRAHLIFMVMNLSETSYRVVWSNGWPKWWPLCSKPLSFIEHWPVSPRAMGLVLVTPGWRKWPCAQGAQSLEAMIHLGALSGLALNVDASHCFPRAQSHLSSTQKSTVMPATLCDTSRPSHDRTSHSGKRNTQVCQF